MKIKKTLFIVSGALIALLFVGAGSNALAQGKGKGRPSSAGNPGNSGSNRGQSGSDDIGKGNSNNSQGNSSNASAKSNGNSNNANDRARIANEKASKMSDTELNRYRGLSKKVGSTPEKMRAYYEAALLTNPDLKYGNFVAANVIADNLHDRFPAITSDAILGGLAKGDSLGRTLQNLGLSNEQAKIAKRDADDKIKIAKQQNQ